MEVDGNCELWVYEMYGNVSCGLEPLHVGSGFGGKWIVNC